MHPLLMLPAMGSDGRLYAPLIDRLSGVSAQTIIADRANIGGCVAQVLALAPERFFLLGTSFGGRVALETALAASERVTGLVVIGAGPAAVADPRAGQRRVERLRSGAFDEVVREMGDMVSHLSGPKGPSTRDTFIAMAHKLGAHRMANQAEAMATRGDITLRLGEIACPALMLWGREDRFAPASDGMRMTAAMPQARYAEIAECGHFPSLEAPDETAAILRHWFDDYFAANA